jgi:hypothetical protein
VALLAAVVIASASTAIADEPLDGLIQKVHEAEKLYDRIDVRYTVRVQNHQKRAWDPVDYIGTHHDLQLGLLYKQTHETTYRKGDGSKSHGFYKSTFDGAVRRSASLNLIGEAFGSISGGVGDNSNALHPHRILTGQLGYYSIPLFVRLQGYDQFPLEARVEQWDGEFVEVTLPKVFEPVRIQGEEQINGLDCVKVSLSRRLKRSRRALIETIWLAKDRNWMPVRMVKQTNEYSETVPFSEGRVEDFREISPGVWFPHHATYTAYDEMILQSENRQVAKQSLELKVENVSLNPAYDISYFRDLEFETGTRVQEYANRKLVREYVVGADEQAVDESSAVEWYRRVPWKKVLPGIAAAVVIAFAIRARRRSATNPTSAETDSFRSQS